MNENVKKFNFTYIVRIWFAVMSIVNLGDSFQFFLNHSLLSTQFYTLSQHYANPAFGRIYGILLFLLAALRFSCAINIHNKSIYNLTLLSFTLLFGNILLELFVFKSASVNFYILLNLFLSGVSIILLLLGFYFVRLEPSSSDRTEQEKHERKKKY
ncbi:ergosterol biosynthetic protein 28 homolog [Crassostrea angulata]|uniref:ergosterol biosynthetic protein 28 homolog n=1 Tax=Magallana angulata TaxID=2784310 RepID=UPI0022B20CFD|nr:ergosterol biosynthetic protein 28 homolog [Crassostrea angulata]